MDERLDALIRDQLGALSPTGELDGSQDLRALGLDSMGTVQLLLDVEETFDINLPDEALRDETFSTPDRLWAAIDRAGQA